MSARPSATELLDTPGAMLTRSDLRELGWQRHAIDAIWRALDVVFYEGQKRGGYVRREDYLALIESWAYGRDRVRPT